MVASSNQVRKGVILGCSLGCMLGALQGSLTQGSALAAIGPVDDAMMDIPVAQPTAIGAASRAPGKPATGVIAGNPLWGIPLNLMSATRERPLFWPSRRPPARIVAAPPPAAPPPVKPAPPAQPSLSIVGTAVSRTQSLGIFVDQTTKAVIRLRVGEGHDGWTLRAIRGREAILQQDRREVTLALPGNNQVAASASPPASAPAQASSLPPVPAPPQASAAQSSWAAQQASGEPRIVPPGMWLDGDGQIITLPPSRAAYSNDAPPRPAWVDGDGQLIAAPSTQTRPR